MNSHGIHIEVECCFDERGDQAPWHFSFGKREVMVVEVLDRWPAREHHYFKLRGDDEAIYLLHHDISHNVWELTLFDSGAIEDTRLSST